MAVGVTADIIARVRRRGGADGRRSLLVVGQEGVRVQAVVGREGERPVLRGVGCRA